MGQENVMLAPSWSRAPPTRSARKKKSIYLKLAIRRIICSYSSESHEKYWF